MIADMLLLVPPTVSLYLWWRGREKKGSEVLSSALLSSGLAVSLKLLFRIGRDVGLDPFSFPSYHSAVASSLFFTMPSPWTAVYVILVGALRVVEGYHSVVDVVGGFLTAGLAWWLFRQLEKRIGPEMHRKSLHYGIAVNVGYFSLFLNHGLQIILTAALLTLTVVTYMLRWVPLVGKIYDFYSREESDVGPITLTGGLFMGSLTGMTSVVGFILAYVDGLASITGTLFHGVKKGLKTVEGLLGGFLGGFITFILLRGFFDPIMLLATVTLAPFVEYYSQMDDNLIISFLVVAVSLLTRVSGTGP